MTVGEFTNQTIIDSAVFGQALLYNIQPPDQYGQGKITMQNFGKIGFTMSHFISHRIVWGSVTTPNPIPIGFTTEFTVKNELNQVEISDFDCNMGSLC